MDTEALLAKYKAEQIANQQVEIKVGLSLAGASAVIANIQLALRHPGNRGPTSELGLEFVELLIERMRVLGLPISAEVAELGNNSAFDV